jgi:hypothetical protein
VASEATVNVPFFAIDAGTCAAIEATFVALGVVAAVVVAFLVVVVLEFELDPQPAMKTAASVQAAMPSRALRRVMFLLIRARESVPSRPGSISEAWRRSNAGASG